MQSLLIQTGNNVRLRLQPKDEGLQIHVTDVGLIIVQIGYISVYPKELVDALTTSLNETFDHIIRPDNEMFGLKVVSEIGNDMVTLFIGQFTRIIQVNLSKDQVRQVIGFIKSHFKVE